MSASVCRNATATRCISCICTCRVFVVLDHCLRLIAVGHMSVSHSRSEVMSSNPSRVELGVRSTWYKASVCSPGNTEQIFKGRRRDAFDTLVDDSPLNSLQVQHSGGHIVLLSVYRTRNLLT